MSNNLDELWSEALARLEAEMPESSFNAWMRATKPIGVYNGTFYVAIRDGFAREWVQARYATDMTRILAQMTGKHYNIHFDTEDAISEEIKQSAVTDLVSDTIVQPGPVSDSDELSPGILNPRYTFHTFVVGNSNRFAHAAALAVAEAPARAYNPLFLYGGVGLGKTHLMQAIGHYVLEKGTAEKVVYVSSEKFTNDLINAIGRKSMGDFRNQYRNVDVLLIDDIQFVAGKESTQEEFFHTFNALYEADKQIIISSDRPPKEIPTLEERLRSRFEWGLITDIQPPDFETRIAILKRKADSENLPVPSAVLEFLADQIDSNIRELEGALNRVVAFASLNGRPIDLEITQQALAGLIKPQRPKTISIATIQQIVSDYYGIKVHEMKGKKRTRAITFPRQVAMYIARELTESSLPKIGDEFGKRDHTTVLHACDKIERERKENPELQEAIEEITRQLKEL